MQGSRLVVGTLKEKKNPIMIPTFHTHLPSPSARLYRAIVNEKTRIGMVSYSVNYIDQTYLRC